MWKLKPRILIDLPRVTDLVNDREEFKTKLDLWNYCNIPFDLIGVCQINKINVLLIFRK